MSDDVTPRPEEERPYATSLTRTPGEIRTVLALAWLKGFMVGYGEIVERLDEITAQYEQDVQA